MQRKREKPAVLENVFLQQAFSNPSATVRGGRKALKRQDGFPVLYNTRFLQKNQKILFFMLTNRAKTLIICGYLIFRGIAQVVEQRSPKPRAEGSNPSAPAKQDKSEHNRLSW